MASLQNRFCQLCIATAFKHRDFMSNLSMNFCALWGTAIYSALSSFFLFPRRLLFCPFNLSSKSDVFCAMNGARMEMCLVHVLWKPNGWGEGEGQCVCMCHYHHLKNALLWNSKPYSNVGCVVQGINRDSPKKCKIALCVCVCVNSFFFHLN